MLVFNINFGNCNSPYPVLGSNVPSARRPGQQFHFLQCRGSLPCLCFVRRVGWVAFTKTYLWGKWLISQFFPTFAIIIHIPMPCPTHPILDVPKSLVSHPRVPSPHTRVPMSPSPYPCPSFIHSQSFSTLVQVVQSWDSAILWINRYLTSG